MAARGALSGATKDFAPARAAALTPDRRGPSNASVVSDEAFSPAASRPPRQTARMRLM